MAKSQTAKTELRRCLRHARLEMLPEEHRLASAAIVERLKHAHDWSKIRSVHYFEPFANLLEPDINGFITYLEDTYPDLKLATSRLIENEWEIIGVHSGPPPDKFGAIIVPALGFDARTLHRIGYGGGYYDRFLAAQPRAYKIGVCFEQGKTEHLPHEADDIALDLILTERKARGV